MNIQRLRNLTTGILHTEIGHVYEDLEYIIGQTGLLTHMLPNVCRAVEPWLREQIADERFWMKTHDPSHVGEFDLRPMTSEESSVALERYKTMRSPLEGKKVVNSQRRVSMAIKTRLEVNETYVVSVAGSWLHIDDTDGDDLLAVDIKDVPDLIKAMQQVYDEHIEDKAVPPVP